MPRLVLSDLDVLRREIAPHVRRAWKVNFKDLAGLYDLWPRLDLLVYTRAELERMVAEDNPLIRQALEEGSCGMKRAKAETARCRPRRRATWGSQSSLREGFFAQACFVCQQAAEKALRALHYLGGARAVLGQSVVELLAPLVPSPGLGDLREGAQQLDQYYIPTRYPNGLPGGVPAEVFTRRQAEEAVGLARRFLAQARAAVG